MTSCPATFNVVVEGAQRCALIGSRKAPKRITDIAVAIGRKLSGMGIHGYSGGAPGMDSHFMFDYSPEKRTIIIPENGFNELYANGVDILDFQKMSSDRAVEEARKVCAHYDQQSDYTQRRYARNSMQVLGISLDSPVDFVLFWAPEKEFCVTGGTAVACRIARSYSIPTFNLWREHVLDEVCEYFEINTKPPTLDFLL